MSSYYSDFLDFEDPGDLSNYYFFRHAFSEDECDKIVDLGLSATEATATAGGVVDPTYRSSDIRWIPFADSSRWIYERMGAMAVTANKAMWKFSVAAMTESLQFGQYFSGEKGHYEWHMDLGKNSSKRKISMVVQLTDPDEYEGGELEMLFGRTPVAIEKGRGHVTVFPSYAMHRVTPVTEGRRQSLVVWVSGEPFR